MSKGLEALKDIRDICSDMTTVFDEDLNIIEKELKHHEHNMSTIIPNLVKTTEEQARVIEEQKKELKALEIIKKKECIFKGLQDVTQEEYNLLKEVLL